MKVTVEEGLHHEHTRVLVTQLVADTVEVLEQHGLFSREQNKGLTKDLMFRLCAVLDGSSYHKLVATAVFQQSQK